MQPLGNKILVRDIIETEEKKTAAGIFLVDSANNPLRKVIIERVSPDSKVRCFDKNEEVVAIRSGDTCLCMPGGIELEKGLWLCNENLLDCKL